MPHQPAAKSVGGLFSTTQMKLCELTLGILAVWRVTHLLNAEDGPWYSMARLRRRAGTGFWGNLIDCFYCLSLWISAPVALWFANAWPERLILWLATSGGAILLERLSSREPIAPPAAYYEDQESENVLLQQAKNAVSQHRPTEKDA